MQTGVSSGEVSQIQNHYQEILAAIINALAQTKDQAEKTQNEPTAETQPSEPEKDREIKIRVDGEVVYQSSTAANAIPDINDLAPRDIDRLGRALNLREGQKFNEKRDIEIEVDGKPMYRMEAGRVTQNDMGKLSQVVKQTSPNLDKQEMEWFDERLAQSQPKTVKAPQSGRGKEMER